MSFHDREFKKPDFNRISDVIWEVPTSFKQGMRVPAQVFTTKKLLGEMDAHVFDQITNVATLPGIVRAAMCMPDGHSGYGFPIGGVAAMDIENGGVISPGGIGFDINCGMRLLRTDLTWKDVEPKLKQLVNLLYDRVPAGVGSAAFDDAAGFAKLSHGQFREMISSGAEWCVEKGYGWKEDLAVTEEEGNAEGADESRVSDKAVKRGLGQVGTLGSGNHYLEIQVVKKENIFDEEYAKKLGIFPGQVVVMFHCGSRGFGHQVATDYLQLFLSVMESKYGIKILDRELACAPFTSKEGQDYFAAMKCGINFSFANRQMIAHRIREAFAQIFGKDAEALGMRQIYDVAHNTAKLEEYEVDGKKKKLLIHRKGATRSLGPGNPNIPKAYRDIGQPVIIGGSMETGSYLLVGTKGAEEQTFGSTAHGAGRTMSRTRAIREIVGNTRDMPRDKARAIERRKVEELVINPMIKKGIYVKSVSYSGLAEEAGFAYKDIDEVIDATAKADISKPVVRLIPVGNVKG
ncbi:MAG: RtcB family protein [Candidatus Aenigmatarchaeota archaeon]|nr:MAG: RtcB family protein [Candidatus Aenigmarchaeota archaeon]